MRLNGLWGTGGWIVKFYRGRHEVDEMDGVDEGRIG